MEQPIEQPRDDGRLRLPQGTVLAGLYEIETELGSGGFGITYRGRDRDIGRLVAIKEYFPVDFSIRDDTKTVRPITTTQRVIFEWGIKSFLREAKLLASFSHTGIVGVLRHFEENGTAYMVLDHVPGHPLRDWPDRLGRKPQPAEVDRITRGLCDALKVVHDRRLVHCDIAPDNIIVKPDGNPVLLDFGAARFELAEQSRILSRGLGTTGTYAVVKPHYSPLEQHSQDKSSRGPWSDVYSLGATLYHLVTGQKPADVIMRATVTPDPLIPAVDAARGSYRQSLLAAIDAALRLRHAERPQSVTEFERQAFAEPARERPQPAPQSAPKPASPRSDIVQPAKPGGFPELPDHRAPPDTSQTRRRAPIAALVVASLALIAGGVALAVYKPWEPQPTPSVAAWIALRDSAAIEVRQAGEQLTKATASVQRSDWRAARLEASEADRRITSARGTIGRLQSTADRGEDRLTASHYKDQLDQMAQTLASIRRNIELGERPVTPPVIAAPVLPPVIRDRPAPDPRAVTATEIERVRRWLETAYFGVTSPQTFDYGLVYAATSTLCGKPFAIADLSRDKRRYFARWPQFKYELKRDTFKLERTDAGLVAAFDYDWRVANDKEERWGLGRARLVLTEVSAGSYRILTEDGCEPVTRNVRQLAVEPPTAPPAPSSTLWRHNGSTMRLVSDGSRRQMLYEVPSDVMLGAGARPGTLLFDGERHGDTYTGTARLFSSACGVNTYQVRGTVSPDQRRVELRGLARRLDRITCQPTAPFEDVLVFELIERTGQAPAVRDFELRLRPGNWAVQVGAFSTETAAASRIDEVRDLFSDTLRPIRSAISNEAHGTATLYKARFVGLDEASVRALCSEIGKVLGADACFPVPAGR